MVVHILNKDISYHTKITAGNLLIHIILLCSLNVEENFLFWLRGVNNTASERCVYTFYVWISFMNNYVNLRTSQFHIGKIYLSYRIILISVCYCRIRPSRLPDLDVQKQNTTRPSAIWDLMTKCDYDFMLQPSDHLHFYVKYPSDLTNTCCFARKQKNQGIVENVVIE